MKKLTTIVFITITVLCGGLFSCKKLLGKLFGGQTIVLPAYSFTVPAIPFADSALENNTGSLTTYINTDSIIRAQTNGHDGISDAATVKVTQVTLTITNGDANNNLSAFKSFHISIASNANATPSNMFSVDIPAYAGASFTAGPYNTANIIGYLRGDTIKNTVYGYIRKTTSRTLNVNAVITMYAN